MARQDRGMDRCDKVRVIYLPDNHKLTIINLKKHIVRKEGISS